MIDRQLWQSRMEVQRRGETRYLPVSEVPRVEMPRFTEAGTCRWCGQPLPKGRRWCLPVPVSREYWYLQEARCRIHYYGWWYSRPAYQRYVLARDNFTCQQCGNRPVKRNEFGIDFPNLSGLAVDHVVPFSKSGLTVPSNLQVLCQRCNSKKGAESKGQLTLAMSETFLDER